jgi:hypothetical protein
MTKPATWVCEWCGKTEEISAFMALFKRFMPRFCPVTAGTCAGWEHPSCRLSHALATRIAERASKLVYDESMKQNKGADLGKLRGHDLVQDINHNEKSIYSGKSHPT